ncbi:hypothetical protein WG8_2136 [Paenibacillus sp. Aloe-11]|nr:hypothetical protein WG8_2136 [Paenibacillus sp. Aloe-11]
MRTNNNGWVQQQNDLSPARTMLS